MVDHNTYDPMSEAAEMYLLRIALLTRGDEPVPIPRLAETLDVSPISANQMCRKLEARGLVAYQPYKGVTLTEQGEAIALRVLRKRRLWEVFLAEKLGVSPQVAEDIACRFEHVTPDDLAEKLADYLDHPVLSPQHKPIPSLSGDASGRRVQPLSALGAGQRARVVSILADEPLKNFLSVQNFGPGTEVRVLAAAEDQALLLVVGGRHITLGFDIARQINVTPLQETRPAEKTPSRHSNPD